MSTRGLHREGLLRRWASPRTPTRRRSRRPTASWPASCTRTRTRATPRPRRASRRSPRRTTSSPTPSGKEYDEARAPVRRGRAGAGGFPGGFRRRRRAAVRPRRPVLGGGAGRRPPGRGGARRPVRRPVRRAGGARPSQAASGPARGQDVETEATLAFDEAVLGVTVPLRMQSPGTCPTCARQRRQARHDPAHLPGLPGHRPGDQPQPGRVRVLRAVPRLPGHRHGRRRPVPDLRGQRRHHADPHDHRPHPGRGHGRAAHPAGRQGRPGRRGGPAGDLYVVVHVAGTGCSAARATTSR